MVRPSPTCSARLQLTTKQVNGGYYKGNRTGSMGAHTRWGGYIIDYRKTRNFNCPDLRNTALTPFVTAQVDPRNLKTKRLDGEAFFEAWAYHNETEYRVMSEKWRERLIGAGEIPEDTQRGSGRAMDFGQDEGFSMQNQDRLHGEPSRMNDGAHAQAREDAMAQLDAMTQREGNTSKSKSWLGRVFRR